MPSYGLKYQSQFKSRSDANNVEKLRTVQFLFKDYTGPTASVIAGDNPALQKCTLDDVFAPVKGQSMDVELVNKNQSLPLTSFYSDDDDGVQVKLLDENGGLLFIGFVVQDDCYEELIDFTHYIRLSVNDSLGLLKGVILNEAPVKRGFIGAWETDTDDFKIHVNAPNPSFYSELNDILEILGVEYTVVSAVAGQHTFNSNVFNWLITVTASSALTFGIGTYYLTYQLNLLQRNSLLDIIAVCLYQTQIPLLLNIFHNVFEYRMGTGVSMFEQAIIDTQLFINGETYDNCYDVLTKVLQTFRCSLFQANGQWNIVHWDELRRYSNNIPGYQYDETFLFLGPALMNNTFNIGIGQLSRSSGLTGGILRAYKFVRKVFNYVFPKYLLMNYDLLKLGDLLADYLGPGGTIRYREYVATSWLGGDTASYVTRFIRVETDVASGNEISRYLVVKGDSGQPSFSKSVRSQPIEVNAGDKIKVSFFVRGVNNGSGTLQFAIMLTDGTTIKYVDDLPVDNGDWINTISG